MAKEFTCLDCGVYNCASLSSSFPKSCLSTSDENEPVLENTISIYNNDPQVSKIMQAAAQVEGQYYGKLTRVEEIIVFAKKIGAKKIGIASCMGLIQESKILTKILRANGLMPYGVICKVGATDKTKVGICENDKIKPNSHESACNPIMQAELCNNEKTDLNIIMGLCVGHDTLFMKYSQAPVTYLIVKDRILAHNPIGALNTSHSYYRRLIDGVDLNEKDSQNL